MSTDPMLDHPPLTQGEFRARFVEVARRELEAAAGDAIRHLQGKIGQLEAENARLMARNNELVDRLRSRQ